MMDNLSYSKGICWIDDCRIPFVDDKDTWNNQVAQDIRGGTFIGVNKGNLDLIKNHNTQGRFPANILVSDDVLNDGTITSIKQNKDYIPPNEANSIHNYTRGKYSGINDKGTNSRYYNLDSWFDKLITDVE